MTRFSWLLALALSGCSALVDTSTVQCTNNAQCAELAPDATCTAEGVCAPAGSGPPCTSHQACSQQLGAPGFCTGAKSCQPLYTPDCPELWPPNALDDPNLSVMMVGFMAATTRSGASYGLPQLAGAKQALSELESQAGGLPALPGVPRRRLAMLVCNQENWVAATEHLTKTLKLPAIVGASYSGVTRQMFEKTVELGEPTLVFSPAATSPTLSTYPDQGLLWRTPPSDTLQIEAIKLVYARLAAALTAPSGAATASVASAQSLRVAVTVKRETAGGALYDALIQRASDKDPNNPVIKPAAPIPASVLLPVQYEDPDTSKPDWNDVVARLLAHRPHIIIPLGTNEFVTQVMGKLENAWPAGQARPWYLMPEGNRVGELLELARTRPDLGARVVGTAPGNRGGEAFSAFAGRFRAEPSNRGSLPGNLAEYAYDAMYLLAYATAISKQAAPSARNLADALPKTSCGEHLTPAGPRLFAGDFAAAARDECIDYVGVSGDFAWNADLGEARGDIDVWCLVDAAGSPSFEPPVNQYQFASGALRDPAFDFAREGWCMRP